MNREFNEFLTYKVLEQKHGFSTAIDLNDHDDTGEIEIKNVCTKMTRQLSDRIDTTVQFLDIRKRKFIEMAIIQALDDADSIIGDFLTSDDKWIEEQRRTGGENHLMHEGEVI